MKQLLRRKKIGIFRALQLGDMICSIPALRAIRQYYPNASIILIGLPWAKEFAQRFSHYIDNFISFPGYPGLPEQPYQSSKTLKFIQNVQNQKFDLLLQMQGDGSIVNPLIQLLNARHTAGFYRQGDYCPDRNSFLEYPNNLSEIEKLLTLVKFFNIPIQKSTLEFPISDTEKCTLYNHPLFQEIKNQPYICIHPGARDSKRRWNPLYFAYIANKLANDYSIVLTGTKSELSIVHQVAKFMKHKAIVFAGKLPLGSTAQLIKQAQLLISNCTSIVHIANALAVPTVTVYLASDPKQWAPLNNTLHKQISGNDIQSPINVLKNAYRLLLDKDNLSSPMKGSFI